jgi:chromosome segregation ATPase
VNGGDTSDAYALSAQLEAANQENARLRAELADLERRYAIRKRDGAKAEHAFAKLYFAITLADTMPGDVDEALKVAMVAINDLRVDHMNLQHELNSALTVAK